MNMKKKITTKSFLVLYIDFHENGWRRSWM